MAASTNAPQENNSKPILGYWKIRGLASAIRFQLAYSKVSFDEEVYEQGDGPGFSCATWTDAKYNQGLTYANLPYLKDGDYSLTESGAIHRYCAKKWCPELLCDDDMEMYGKTEMAWGVYCDIKSFFNTKCYTGDGNKKALTEGAIPRFAVVAKELSNNKFIIGDRLCCADFAMVELVEMANVLSDGEFFTVYPSLKDYRDRVFALPGIKEQVEAEGKYTFNNKCALINN